MGWFNFFGLGIMATILIPNVVFAVKFPNAFQNTYKNKIVLFLEQISRYGCFALMVFNVPHTYVGFWFSNGIETYLVTNGVLLLAYVVLWIVLRNKQVLRAYFLSIIPSTIFLFSGIALLNVPLLVFAVIFAFSHVTVSLKYAYRKEK